MRRESPLGDNLVVATTLTWGDWILIPLPTMQFNFCGQLLETDEERCLSSLSPHVEANKKGKTYKNDVACSIKIPSKVCQKILNHTLFFFSPSSWGGLHFRPQTNEPR